jgi:uncharacterized protein YqeY
LEWVENSVKEKLQSDLKTAMKSGDKLRLMTVRGILSEVTRLEKEVCRAANEDEIIQIIKRERARRDESLDFARRGKRFDLITQYEAEAKVLEGYLPPAVAVEDLNAAVAAQIAAGANQIGPIMKALRDQFGASLDGKMASAAVKTALAPK